MSEQGAGFAAIRIVRVAQNFIEDYLGLLVFTLSDALFGQFHTAFAEATERGRVPDFPADGGIRQIAQRRAKIVMRRERTVCVQLRLRAGQDFFAARHGSLATGSFAISNFVNTLRLHGRGQAKDQSRHDEPEIRRRVFS